MASPNSRQTFIDYCLRKLGEPVIEVNVDPDQIEDKVDDALQKYREFHSDATVRIFLKHEMTADDIANKYVPISDDIIYYDVRLKWAVPKSSVTGYPAQSYF